jgi:hypothetical protein
VIALECQCHGQPRRENAKLAHCRNHQEPPASSSSALDHQLSIALSLLGCHPSVLASKALGCALLPILEPYLYLSRAQARDLSRKPFSMCGVWMSLFCKFTHQKTGLLMGESRLLLVGSKTTMGLVVLPETFHFPALCSTFGGCLWGSALFWLWI